MNNIDVEVQTETLEKDTVRGSRWRKSIAARMRRHKTKVYKILHKLKEEKEAQRRYDADLNLKKKGS